MTTLKLLLGLMLSLSLPSFAYEVRNGEIIDSENREVKLRGINWFGFETSDHVAHGLWSRNWQDMISQMKSLGFNAVRIPVCPATLHGSPTTSIDYAKNPGLLGKNSLEILDEVLAELNAQNFYILLDHHRPDCNAISELWYTDTYSEQQWIDDLVFMANRYKGLKGLIGIDLKNEPHGAATWGTGNPLTDWNTAAEKASAAILSTAPDLLIFVEGVQENPGCSGTINHWWGGNLEPVNCHPLNIPANRLVYSPHVYGPDVYAQPYFDAANFPANLPAIWDTHFGFLMDKGYKVSIGEFGGRYGHGGDANDKLWQDALVDYLVEKGQTGHFYWSWNPNSGDTGGILQDDWQNVWTDKVELLQRLWGDDTPDEQFRRVAYLNTPFGNTDWQQFPQLFDKSYDYLLLAFLLPDTNGNLSPVDAVTAIDSETLSAIQDSGTQVGISIGGSTVDYGVYVTIAGNPVVRQRFIDNTLAAVENGGYDGVDLNFEGWWLRANLTQNDVDTVNALIRDTAAALKAAGKTVTVTLGGFWYLPASADCATINSDDIDYALHMSYDYSVGVGGANGPYRRPQQTGWLWPGNEHTESSVYGALRYLIDQKQCDPRKLVAGIPFYDTDFTAWHELRNTTDWNSISLHADYLEKQHPATGTWVNDTEAVKAKIEAYQSLGLGGALVWQVGHEGPAADLTAAITGAPTQTQTQCNDNIDNDGDTLTDYPGDPGCDSPEDNDEYNAPPPACSDQADNDLDGLTDYPRDPGCSSATDNDEYNSPDNGSQDTVSYQLVVNDDWGHGYCANVSIRNNSLQTVTWNATLPIEGSINNYWNADVSQSGVNITASGEVWNSTLAPDQSTSFGFCADKQPAASYACSDGTDNDSDGLVDYPEDSGCNSPEDNDEFNPPDNGGDPDDGNGGDPDPDTGDSGVETTVAITSDWTSGYCAAVTVRNGGSAALDWQVSLTIDGQISSLWNGSYTLSGNSLSVQGVDWNNILPAGQSTEFGFCANR